jgi:hypothetical protein
MLDVHPAHHAATTWRDFLIRIATIVLGVPHHQRPGPSAR